MIHTGPVVRINPRELHIKDPSYYDEIYASSAKKREKDPSFVVTFGAPSSMVSTVGHEHHRFRRGLLNSFFSKRSVMELLPLLYEKKSKLMQRFEKAHQDDKVLQLGDAFSAFTADLISQYSWGLCSGFLDDENFNNNFRDALTEMATTVHLYRFFPLVNIIATAMPHWILSIIKPNITSVLAMQETVAQQSTMIQNELSTKPSATRKTIFDALTDLSVPPQERTRRRLQDEGLIVLLAGTETTARVLATAAFYIYQNKLLLTKLREELGPVMPTLTTEPSWTQLEQLPYLVRTLSCVLLLIWGLDK